MKRKLIIYILILAAVISGYIAVSIPGKRTEEEKTDTVRLFEGFEISAAIIENGYGKYTVEYDAPSWMIDGKEANGKYIESLSQIYARPIQRPDGLGAYGLEKPAAQVTLKSRNGEERSLLIGDMLPDKTGRYVMCKEIYAVRDEYISCFLEGKDIFKDKVILNIALPERVEYNGICFEIKDGAWRMTSPYDHGVRGEEFNKELLEGLFLTAVDFPKISPSACGLEPPKGYVSVWDAENKKTTVYFGNRENGLIYAMKEDGGEVCRINTPSFLEREPLFYLNTLCYVKNIDTVESIVIDGILFEISEEGYKKNGRIIEKDAFIGFYKQIMGMTLIGEASAPVRDEPVLRMEVRFKDGTEDTVEVCRYKERYGAVYINGECTFYVLLSSAEEIAEAAEKL